MTITTVDQLVAAMTASDRERKQIAKLAIGAGFAAGRQVSTWKQGNYPAAGATPTSAATCNNTTLGGLNYTNPTGGKSAYLAKAVISCGATAGIEFHDRLAHMGGLNATLTTAQTVGLDLNSLAGTDNISVRKGPSDYSAVQWFLEWYVLSGGTGVNATISYTNQNGTAGQTVVVAVPATMAVGGVLQILPNAGDGIRSIESVTLSATTGTAGNFGVTATVERASISCPVANLSVVNDWASLGLSQLYDSTCLTIIADITGTSLGAIGGSALIVKG